MKNKLSIKLAAFLIIGFFYSTVGLSQGQYTTENAVLTFFSDAPLEDIKADNKDAKGVIDFTKKEFAFKAPIKSFKFEKGLMQEHFNENYMESEKFPSAIFKGTIEGNYDLSKDGEYPINAVGNLLIHGVTKKRTLPATLKVEKGKVSIQSKFMVKLEDHNIKIPTLVFQKIAEEVEVSLTSLLKPVKK